MKLLVIARRLHIDRSSEGICSSKFVLALARAGVDFVCLTGDDLAAQPVGRAVFGVPWLPGVRLYHTDPFASKPSVVDRVHAQAMMRRGTAVAVAARQADSGLFFLTGHRLATHQKIQTWQRAVVAMIETERPTAIIVRGEGMSFDPHLALARLRPRTPWIAHYHDPYPSSLYPEPYRTVLPLASRRQERGHEAILRHSSALTFPSRRMLQWVLQGRFASLRSKGFVLPHLATDVPTPEAPHSPAVVEPHTFTLMHTGALLGPRRPDGLIAGFRRFVGDDALRRERARLVLAGPIHPAHLIGLPSDDTIRCVDARLGYRESLDLAHQASVNVVIEATGAATSPFLPAKFADYVYLSKPILALSIKESSVADALGRESPLLVPPDDSEAIARAIETLWRAWQADRLVQYAPSNALRQQLSERTMLDELRRALTFASVKSNGALTQAMVAGGAEEMSAFRGV